MSGAAFPLNPVVEQMRQLKIDRAARIVEKGLLIGLGLEKARRFVNQHGVRTRVIMKDGVARLVTQDVRLDRINVHVVDNKVEHAYVG
jgi:hypothetical protein